MSELFEDFEPSKKDEPINLNSPLADRVRPKSIDEVAGQKHLIGENGPLRLLFESKEFPSIIFWGPPGVGKTTLANLISKSGKYHFQKLSAVESGVKEVREVIAMAQKLQKSGKRTLLFIDEIHRFNKSQQDALLNAVENGTIILIGATTENPSFEVNSALISRSCVYHLQPLNEDEIKELIYRALKSDIILSKYEIEIEDIAHLVKISGGDARTALNAVDIAFKIAKKNENNQYILTKKLIEIAVQQKTAQYDKAGENHYDTISAFIKSMRGSDPDAALFWLAKMLNAGEDPKFIARRMVIFASEDIGNADPMALQLAVSVFNAVNLIGMPECRINLAQGVTYLASTYKSNSSYMGIERAMADINNGADTSVPLHLRNAPTKLMKDECYSLNYKYPHDFDEHFVNECYFPSEKSEKIYYKPADSGKEKEFKERLNKLFMVRNRKY